ncbi:MAG: hypothetical protein CVV64_08005 [Candidatus Wallbacteria bacterium HGW-Wallbacteria-1]|jgi:two-component system chemotaxis response regulator CheY|uniref:Response regulatory domain-containing protein n=1 Tax=Candidatus Wallbacteria bacterium HGW-Wallbacteria-1 TaxID=2013854 RepID=A0A2N1PR42_9BACT|nr:MAG: hypothetical protein CVV64_08005 [Candidatus Wallbacteria bacterium HGW-Wallbacteria-1]
MTSMATFDSTDPRILRQALLDEKLISLPESISSIEALIAEGDHVVRLLALDALSRIGKVSDLGSMVNIIRNVDEECILREASEKLVMEMAPSRASELGAFLEDDDPTVRDLFIRIAGANHIRECLGHLIGLLEKVMNGDIDIFQVPVNDIVASVGKMGDSKSVASLEKFMSRCDDNLLKAQIAESIGTIGGSEAVDALVDFTANADEFVALSAIRGLGSCKDEKALPVLVRLLTNDSPVLRNGASDALVLFGLQSIPVLVEALESSDDDFVILSSNTLGFIGLQEAINPLSKLFFHESSNIRYAAIEAVGKIGGPKAIVKLSTALMDTSEQVKIAAIQSFESIGDSRILPNLLKHVDDSKGVKFAVLSAAIGLGGYEHLKELMERQDIREAMAEVIHEKSQEHPISEVEQEIAAIFDLSVRDKMGQVLELVRSRDSKEGRILVVDDSRAMRSYVNSLIKERYDTVLAQDGQEALEIFNDNFGAFDFILTDMNMPRMDGISLVKAVREQNPIIPIVMLTTESDEKDKEQGFSAGVNNYLTKPFKPDELTSMIDSLIRKE